MMHVLLAVLLALPTGQAAPKRYVNCAALQHDFPHGVARAGATDKVARRAKPVTTFTVNQAAYDANKRLDADKDGVACERR
ncbi:excalibur calcium-binding domain-containing protein [Dactylosporangium sp. CS-047395]|jgi:hypothetical protein|uniref:excalibur calcium-binding domain-containing protein n=1 Tax=Dactylosporangium sp. CS-047395 TaxID=3239936 RepID=UPI003D909D7D